MTWTSLKPFIMFALLFLSYCFVLSPWLSIGIQTYSGPCYMITIQSLSVGKDGRTTQKAAVAHYYYYCSLIEGPADKFCSEFINDKSACLQFNTYFRAFGALQPRPGEDSWKVRTSTGSVVVNNRWEIRPVRLDRWNHNNIGNSQSRVTHLPCLIRTLP